MDRRKKLTVIIAALLALALIAGLAGNALTAEKIDKKLKKQFNSLIKSPNPTDRVQAVNLLANMPADYAVKKLVTIISSDTSSDVVEAAFGVLNGHVSDEYTSLIVKGAKKAKTIYALTEYLKILWKLDDPKAFNIVLKNLSHVVMVKNVETMWPVRMCVAELLAAAFKEKGVESAKKAVDALIQWLPREPDGRTKKYMRAALWYLLGRDYKYDMKKWRAYWKENRELYEGPYKKPGAKNTEPAVTPDGKIDLSTALDEEPPPDDGSAKKPTFFGQEIGKRRVSFVIDISGSMREASTGGSKMQVVKNEMVKTINSFDNSFKFNMYFYSTGVVAWKPSIVKATPSIRTEAVAHVNKQSPYGMTNIAGALKRAGEDADVQTIFLLSDGKPTAGITDTTMLLKDVRSWNQFKKIKINTIGMAGCDANFMQKLANENGGKYSTAP